MSGTMLWPELYHDNGWSLKGTLIFKFDVIPFSFLTEKVFPITNLRGEILRFEAMPADNSWTCAPSANSPQPQFDMYLNTK